MVRSGEKTLVQVANRLEEIIKVKIPNEPQITIKEKSDYILSDTMWRALCANVLLLGWGSKDGVTNPFGLVGSACFVCRNACVIWVRACMARGVQSLSSRCRWLTTWGGVSLYYKEPALPEFRGEQERKGARDQTVYVLCPNFENWYFGNWNFVD